MASKYSMNDRPSWPRRAIVTAGEPYGNKGLHFGHVGGVFVPADFFARFLRDRLGRENVIFTSGTDCYGSPIMESYRKLKENEGYDKSIGEYVESNHSRQAATLNNYNISCDIYGGSGLEPAAQIHNEVTAEIIERLHEQGTISKRSTLQFYDAKAGTFLNGRQVIVRCPIQGCKSEKAYADECDLGHQFEPEELIAPKSQLTGEVPELRPVDNLYFDLPAYLDFMKTYTAKLAQNPQVRSVVSKTMEEWLLPAQLYIQNKFREAFDAVEDQLPEHTVLEPEGNKSSFNVASYESLYFKGTADSTKDDDGNTVEPTDEENAAAKAKAESDAAAVLARVQGGEALEDVAKDYESASYTSTDAGSNNGSDVANWVFDSARKAGDSAVVASDPNCYVVVFRSVGRQEYATKDVRHILFKVDESALDSEAETYEADLQAAKDAAKTAAEDALAQWKAGEATEDSFAALANELSADDGSNTNGGLYTKIYKNQMVTEFNDWCFDASRQSGDTGIVYGESSNYKGYHVIYFVGDDVPYWQVQAENALRNTDTEAWLDGLLDSADVVQENGMKHVG